MTLDEKNQLLKDLNPEGLLTLGAPHIAYMKEIDFQGKKRFSVHSADGAAMIIAPNREQALSVIEAKDMQPVTLH